MKKKISWKKIAEDKQKDIEDLNGIVTKQQVINEGIIKYSSQLAEINKNLVRKVRTEKFDFWLVSIIAALSLIYIIIN